MEGFPVLLLMLVPAALCTLLACIDQRKIWYYTRGWAYANPAANEPSQAYYAFTRVSLVLLAMGSIAMGFWIMAAADNEPTAGADYDSSTGEDNTAPQHGTALGLRGSERFERLDGPESPGSAAPGQEGPAPREWDQALPATAETVEAILPDQAAMRPSRFADQREEPEVGSVTEAYACAAIDALCDSLQTYGDIEYATTNGSHVVEFQVLAYDSAMAAQRALDAVELYYAGSEDYLETYDPEYGPDYGEDAMASYEDYTTTFDSGSPRAASDFIRQGPYLGVIWLAADYGHGHDPDNVGTERRLNQLIALRMGQAKRGEQPDATASDAYQELLY
jgi:hypothetical protein